VIFIIIGLIVGGVLGCLTILKDDNEHLKILLELANESEYAKEIIEVINEANNRMLNKYRK